MNVEAALKGQYHAALNMLRMAIEACPEDLWDEARNPVPFWRVAYHVLHGTHLYLQPRLEDFVPWESHREGHNDLPWPLESAAPIEGPYSKADVMEYWGIVNGMVDGAVDRLDLTSLGSGFPWHAHIPKLEHQMMSIRHVQHHAAMLSARLRHALGTAVDLPWVRTNSQTYKD